MNHEEEIAPITEDLRLRGPALWLLASVLFSSTSGLVYELVAGTLASYLLGDSVTQFSIVVGLFVSAMGLGAYLSQFIKGHELDALVALEVVVGVIGGLSGLLTFIAFATGPFVQGVLWSSSILVGTLVGAEIPLVIRIFESQNKKLPVSLAQVMSIDYAGALLASLAFPFVLLPLLGNIRAGIAMGLLNIASGAVLYFKPIMRIHRLRTLRWSLLASGALLSLSLLFASSLTTRLEDALYQDPIVHAQTTPYQRIVITRWRKDIRLYLNGHLQFSSIDEYRYHETLVHSALSYIKNPKNVLILGGGDGLAAREVFRYPSIQKVSLVDLDPAITTLFSTQKMFKDLNENSLQNSRLTIFHQDAMQFLTENREHFDAIIVDLPDPSEAVLGKLYSAPFYRLLSQRLRPEGIAITQATSPFRSKDAFASIIATMRYGMPKRHITPLHTNVPTFGIWGFVAAYPALKSKEVQSLPPNLRYINHQTLHAAQTWPEDMNFAPQEIENAEVNTLAGAEIVQAYRRGYHQYLD